MGNLGWNFPPGSIVQSAAYARPSGRADVSPKRLDKRTDRNGGRQFTYRGSEGS
jgi:hypothetical protein